MNLSVGVEELPQTIERLQSEARSVRKERNRLHELLLDHEALALIAKSRTVGTVLVVTQMFESREMEEVRRLATRIATQPGHVALLGVKGEKGQLVFARATDLSCDMRPLLHEACRMLGGGGGGGRDLAQGGGPHADRVGEALQHATQLLRRQIEQSDNDCR
jgi:alanyl-tRNA synthetase